MSGTTVTGSSNTTNVILNSAGSTITEDDGVAAVATVTATNLLEDNFTTKISIKDNQFSPSCALVKKHAILTMENLPGNGVHSVYGHNINLNCSATSVQNPNGMPFQSFAYPYIGAGPKLQEYAEAVADPGPWWGYADKQPYYWYGGGLGDQSYDMSWSFDMKFGKVENLTYSCAPHQSMKGAFQIVGQMKFPSDGSYIRCITPPNSPVMASNALDASGNTKKGYPLWTHGLFERIEVSASMDTIKIYAPDTRRFWQGGVSPANYSNSNAHDNSGVWKDPHTLTWVEDSSCYAVDTTPTKIKTLAGNTVAAVNWPKNMLGTTWEFLTLDYDGDGGNDYSGNDQIPILGANLTVTAADLTAYDNSYNADFSGRKYFRSTSSIQASTHTGSAYSYQFQPNPADWVTDQDIWYLQSETDWSNYVHMGRDISGGNSAYGYFEQSSFQFAKDIKVPGNIYKLMSAADGCTAAQIAADISFYQGIPPPL